MKENRVAAMGEGKDAEGILRASGKAYCENTSLHGFSYWVSEGEQCDKSHV